MIPPFHGRVRNDFQLMNPCGTIFGALLTFVLLGLIVYVCSRGTIHTKKEREPNFLCLVVAYCPGCMKNRGEDQMDFYFLLLTS